MLPVNNEASVANPDLREYLRVLYRRRTVIVLTTLVVLAGALAAAFLQTPVYQAAAEVLLQERATESLFDPNTGQARDPARAVETQLQVLKSKPVEAAVRSELGSAPKVLARAVGETDVIEVKAEDGEPRQAARIANAYAAAYIDFRRKQAVDDVLAAGQEVQNKVDDLQRRIDHLNEQVSRASPAQRQEVEGSVAAQRQALVAQQTLFRQKLDQLQVDAALKTGGAQLVTPAAVPTSPTRPRPARSAVIGLVVGAIFGVGLAFLRDFLDDSIKSKEDVERVARGVPTLALIPAVASWKNRNQPVLVSLTDPKSSAAEAYRTLRTSIQFMGLDRPMRTVQVTSPSASEGKSTTLGNLGVALAEAGQRVIIVCCDLRRPRIHEFFGLSNSVGFTSVLLRDVPLSSALQHVEGVDRLQLLASGPVPPNPSELLSGRRTVEALTAVQADADVVLIDCPPVLPVTDAAVLSGRVDATLLVATAGSTTRKELQRAHELLTQVEAPIIGTVLNGVSGENGYGYSYSYTYSEADPEKKKQRTQLFAASNGGRGPEEPVRSEQKLGRAPW